MYTYLNQHLLFLVLQFATGSFLTALTSDLLLECQLLIPDGSDHQHAASVVNTNLLKFIIAEGFAAKFYVLVAQVRQYRRV